jgi:superfamily II DNA or RNA helicase
VYAAEGRVEILLQDEDTIEAVVEGSRKTPYQVNIYIIDGEDIEADCTCPVGYHCKHMVAVGAEVIKLLKGQKGGAESKVVELKAFSVQEETLGYSEGQWLRSLGQEAESKKETNQALVYLLKKDFGYQRYLLLTRFASARVKKNGEIGASSFKEYDAASLLQRIPEVIRQALTEEDWGLIQLVWQKQLRPETEELSMIEKMVATGRCFWEGVEKKPLQWGVEKEANLEWEAITAAKQQVRLVSVSSHLQLFVLKGGGFYVDPVESVCGLLRLPAEATTVRKILNGPQVETQKVPLVQKKLAELVPNVRVKEKRYIDLGRAIPKFHFHVVVKESWNDEEQIEGVLSSEYGGGRIVFSSNSPETFRLEKGDEIYVGRRDIKLETDAAKQLERMGWRFGGYPQPRFLYLDSEDLEQDAIRLSTECFPKLRKLGWEISLDAEFPIQKLSEAEDWYAEVSGGKEDWFDLELGPLVDGKRVNLIPQLREFLPLMAEQANFFERLTEEQLKEKLPFKTAEGEFIMIPLFRLKGMFEALLGLFDDKSKGERLRVSVWQTGALTGLEESFGKLQWQIPKRYQELRESFRQAGKIQAVAAPKGLRCELRPYQLQGLSWLQFLRGTKLSGILADDMGLGKTVQTLAHLLVEKESGRMVSPALIIAPTSLMGNWLLEAIRFAPELKVLVLQGDQRKERFEQIAKNDLILTTYPLLARDQEILLKHSFHLLILDEAQNVKNAKTQAHQVLRQIRAEHRVCLTGTPMENHLGELWSLFHLLLPGFLGDEKQFYKLFRKPIEKEGSLERKKILQQRIRPFMLRRTKQEVVLELPPKTEILMPLELTDKQKDLYEAVRLAMMEKVLAQVQEKGLARSRIIVLDALLKLRQICCDPRLLKSAKKVEAEDSAKLMYLREALPQMIEEKRQILLFSQFSSMLALIEKELEKLGIAYTMITGDTADRVTPVQDFQAGKVPIFLISLKAGGTGLNLTAADTVIHYDPWWNPAVEAQATDRAHRIGQTKSVFVYKLISKGSVEEKILGLQTKKKALAAGLFDGSAAAPLEMNLEELQSLFEPLV